ncbi:hypothetical protein [Streptomyces sp. NPDC093225]|uniref:hypothetical protein n=1 Tax=Streptomyces sp. NPDC093225 TaxID=3366034 RepID=UPI0037F45B5A
MLAPPDLPYFAGKYRSGRSSASWAGFQDCDGDVSEVVAGVGGGDAAEDVDGPVPDGEALVEVVLLEVGGDSSNL